MNDVRTLDNFPRNSASFKFKQKITGLIGNDGTKAVEIMVALKYLGNFWRILEMPLINCKINLILTWSENCVIYNAAANQVTTLAIVDTKLYVLVIALSIDDNVKLLEQVNSGFKRRINWNKHETKTTAQNAPNQYFYYLIKPSFQGVNNFLF